MEASPQVVLPSLEQIAIKKKGGLITKEFFEHTLNNIAWFTNQNSSPLPVKTVKFSNEDYYPLYSLGFHPDSFLPARELLNANFELDSYERAYRGGSWKLNMLYVNFLKACLEKKYYNLLLFIRHETARTLKTAEGLSTYLKHKFTEFVVGKPYVPHFSQDLVSLTGSFVEAFEHVRSTNRWMVYTTRKTAKDETRKVYLMNMFFMAEMSDNSFYNLGKANINPMFCVMVRKENMPLIRAHFISNLPIQSSLLELWVDKSVEAEGSKLKPHFRKNIKSRLQSTGVVVKYFDNLKEEIIDEFVPPKFQTLEDRDKWSADTLNSYYAVREGRMIYKSSPYSPVQDPKIEAILEVFKKEVEDVKASIAS